MCARTISYCPPHNQEAVLLRRASNLYKWYNNASPSKAREIRPVGEAFASFTRSTCLHHSAEARFLNN